MSTSNRLLDALSPEARALILSQATAVPLPVRTSLAIPEEPPQYAYFMTAGIASVVVTLEDGGATEVGVIGYEGLANGIHLLGPALQSNSTFMQVAGSGFRIPIPALRKLFLDSEEVRMRILEYVQYLHIVVMQVAGCNKMHEAEARLARWLLMVRDRIGSDTLPLTQEFLAQMLGTQRTTVAVAAGTLQKAGLIEYSRGKVRIVDPEGFTDAACRCYEITREPLLALYKR